MYLFNYRSNDDDFHSEGLDLAYEDPNKVEKSAPPNMCQTSDEITVIVCSR